MTGLEVAVTLGGSSLIAGLAYYFFGPKKAEEAEVKGGLQEVRITVKGGYSPDVIRVKEGVPLRLVFDRQEAGDCSSRVVFPDFQMSKTLTPFGTTTMEFIPDKPGTFGFACGMNMLHGTIIVESDEGQGKAIRETASPTNGHRKFAEAVGVGPRLEVAQPTKAELSILGGGVNCPT